MKKLFSYCAASALLATGAVAAPVGFGFNAGAVTQIDDVQATGAFAGFVIGEDLFVEFTIDDGTPDTEAADDDANYEDPAGTIKITGLTSNTMIMMNLGVEVEFDDPGEFELESLEENADDTDSGYFLDGDADVDTDETPPLVSDPENLAQSISELQALLDAQGVFSGIVNTTTNVAEINFFVPRDGEIGPNATLVFGPVPTNPAAIPLPAGGALLISGVLALGVARRFKRKAA